MPKLEIEYTEEQMKAMSWQVVDPLGWIQHAWNDKTRRCIDRLVEEASDKQPQKLSQAKKLEIVRKVKVKTRSQRDVEEEVKRLRR